MCQITGSLRQRGGQNAARAVQSGTDDRQKQNQTGKKKKKKQQACEASLDFDWTSHRKDLPLDVISGEQQDRWGFANTWG